MDKGSKKIPLLKPALWGLLILAIAIMAVVFMKKDGDNVTTQNSMITPMTEAVVPQGAISPELVCMVNDQYMGREQIPVSADDKVYYGCCQGCVDKIKDNLGDVRFASDPLTGERVDKALAYIVLKPDGDGSVWYFKSEGNFQTFKNQ